MMIQFPTLILLYLTFCAFAYKRTMTYLHAYQQEEYDSPRFIRWIRRHKVFDKRLSAALFILTIAASFTAPFLTHFLCFLAFAVTIYLEKDPRKDSKKKLVMTDRAKRIFNPACCIAVLSGLWCLILPNIPLLWIINIQLIPLWIIGVNALLQPQEQKIQRKFWQEAHNKIMDYQPKIIAVTGSYGKTSFKHILGHILKLNAPTLITPGSVNTPMGISRIIREELEPEHEYFVVEMGAYGPGSIEGLCKLTPPDMGVITAIGHAHYERFKSLDTVAAAKYELARDVLSRPEGKVIVHERTLRFHSTLTLRHENKDRFVVVGDSPPIDKAKQTDPNYLIKDDLEIFTIDQLRKGIEIRFNWKNTLHVVEAPLFGIHHGYNVAMAFAAAIELGIDKKDIQTALTSLPQIPHRLEVRPKADGTIVIDDSYNSNPVGFQAALGLLNVLGAEGRKILITPGMVELGSTHEDAHEKMGGFAAMSCDIAIVINSKRIPSFIKGYKMNAPDKLLIEVNTFRDAQMWVANNRQAGDYILIENDLPDIFERIPQM